MTLHDRDAPPYRVRLDGAHVRPTVVGAIAAVASEFPGRCALVLDVAGTERSVQLGQRVDPTHLFERALRRVVQAHAVG